MNRLLKFFFSIDPAELEKDPEKLKIESCAMKKTVLLLRFLLTHFKKGKQIIHLTTDLLIEHFDQSKRMDLACSFIRKFDPHTFDDSLFNKLKRLKVLNLSSNKITELESKTFYQLKSIKALIINDCCLNSLDSKEIFNGLENLTTLEIYNNNNENFKISDFCFEYLINLKSLELSKNKIRSVTKETFFNLKNLKRLNLDKNLLEDLEDFSFSHLSNTLEYLRLAKNLLSRINFNAFKCLFKLKKLYLSENFLVNLDRIGSSSSLLEDLASLELLYLNENKLKEINRNCFWNLKNLLLLDLSSNLIETIETDVFRNLKKLNKLNLSKNFIRHLDDDTFFGLDQLSEINLSLNEINLNKNVYLFSYLDNLKVLNLAENQIGILNENLFSKCKLLIKLLLNKNKLRNFSLDKIKHLTNLKYLDLRENNLDELDELLLNRLLNLETLKLID